MKKIKKNLKNIIEEIEWAVIESNRGGGKLSSDAISVGFVASKKSKPDLINRVVIRLGANVVEKLKWNTGDKIVVMHDKKNLMNFLLVKTEAGRGFNLSKESLVNSHKVQFTWSHKTSLIKRSHGIVDYHIQNNQLIIFTIDPLKNTRN